MEWGGEVSGEDFTQVSGWNGVEISCGWSGDCCETIGISSWGGGGGGGGGKLMDHVTATARGG